MVSGRMRRRQKVFYFLVNIFYFFLLLLFLVGKGCDIETLERAGLWRKISALRKIVLKAETRFWAFVARARDDNKITPSEYKWYGFDCYAASVSDAAFAGYLVL